MSDQLPEYPSADLSVEELLLLHLNARNQTAVLLSEVVFGVPVLIDASATNIHQAPRNSTIRMSSTPDARRAFDTELHYNRIFIPNLFYGRDHVLSGQPTSTRDLAPQLAAISGMPISAEDLVDRPIDGAGVWPLVVDVEAHPESRTYFGLERFTVTGAAP